MEETESESGDMRSVARSKGATVWEEGIAELTELIEALTTVVKSSSVPGKFGSPMKNKYKFQKKDGTSAPNSPKKTRGPGTSAAVPYKLGQKLIQCYNCGGWEHGWRNCPTTAGNVDWRSLNRAKLPPMEEEQGPTQNCKSRNGARGI